MKKLISIICIVVVAIVVAPSIVSAQTSYHYNGAPVSVLDGRPVIFVNNQPLIVPQGAVLCNHATAQEARYDAAQGFVDLGTICPGFDDRFDNSVNQQRGFDGNGFGGGGTGFSGGGNQQFNTVIDPFAGNVDPTGQTVLAGNQAAGQVCGFGTPNSLQCLIVFLLRIIQQLIPVVMTLALLFFFWGIARFILAARSGNEEEIKSGKQLMFWGIIALFVMVSIWGIIALFTNDLGVPLVIPLLPDQLNVSGIRN